MPLALELWRRSRLAHLPEGSEFRQTSEAAAPATAEAQRSVVGRAKGDRPLGEGPNRMPTPWSTEH
jgi:hypothetical protein